MALPARRVIQSPIREPSNLPPTPPPCSYASRSRSPRSRFSPAVGGSRFVGDVGADSSAMWEPLQRGLGSHFSGDPAAAGQYSPALSPQPNDRFQSSTEA